MEGREDFWGGGSVQAEGWHIAPPWTGDQAWLVGGVKEAGVAHV